MSLKLYCYLYIKDIKKGGQFSMKLFIECIISVLVEPSKHKYRKYITPIVIFLVYVLLFKDVDIIKDIFKLILFELVKKCIFR